MGNHTEGSTNTRGRGLVIAEKFLDGYQVAPENKKLVAIKGVVVGGERLKHQIKLVPHQMSFPKIKIGL